MPQLNLAFEFLCALVPPDLFANSPKRCWVVLPDFWKHPKRPHSAMILYDRDDRVADKDLIKAGGTPMQAGAVTPNAGEAWDGLDLVGYEIEVQPDGAAVAGNDALLTGSLDSLLRIKNTGIPLEVFDENLLTGTKGPACRMLLRSGELTATLLTANKFGVYNRSVSNVAVHEQYMARQIVHSVAFKSFVDLVFRKLDQTAVGTLRLKNPGGKNVEVTMRNSESGVIWNEDLPEYDQQHSDETNLFFESAKGYDEKNPPPTITLEMLTFGGGGICAPKAFDSWG